MLGTSGKTADDDYTTYVENIKVHRQIYGGIADLGNVGGSITIDCENGNTQYFTMTGACAVSFANLKEGATYIIKVKQGGSSNFLSWPVSIKWPNGVSPTNSQTINAEDILTFVYIGGALYGNIKKLFS
jgi:hypothetical protein